MVINLKRSALLSAAVLGSAMLTFGAHAQNTPRSVTVDILPLSTQITYSKDAGNKTPALKSLIGALVTITNESGNTLNNVYFEPSWVVLDPNGSPSTTLTATFAPSDGSPCTTENGGVVCPVGQLQAQLPTSSFVIFFNSPTVNELNPPTRTFRLGGKAYFAEGTNDKPDAPNSSSSAPVADVFLGTSNPVLVKSGVKKTGTGEDNIFTGEGGVPVGTTNSSNAALLYVPGLPSSNYGFAALAINKPNSGTSNGVDQCPTAASGCLALFSITVADKDPATSPTFTTFEFKNPNGAKKDDYLLITLRRSADLFKGNINNAPVYYFYEGDSKWQAIDPCSDGTDPLEGVKFLGQPADRCVLDRKVLRNSDSEVQENPALKGVAQIKVVAKKNGWVAW